MAWFSPIFPRPEATLIFPPSLPFVFELTIEIYNGIRWIWTGVAVGQKDHVLVIRRGLKMKIFPAITLTLYLRRLHLQFGFKSKGVENERINTTKEKKSLLNVQEMSRSKHQSARDVNEK